MVELSLCADTLQRNARAASSLSDDASARGREVSAYAQALHQAGFAGEAALAALSNLNSAAEHWAEIAATYRQLAALISETAELHRPLERVFERTLAFRGLHPGSDALILAIMTYLMALSRMLDMNTAAVLNGRPIELNTNLSDMKGLDLDTVHELSMLRAPTEVRALVAAHKDIRILETPDGGYVAAIGNIDTASKTITYVPGVKAANPEKWSNHIEYTRDMAYATGSAGIVWLGYNSPPSVLAGIDGRPGEEGGAALAEFQRELHERNPHAKKTVVGYSYGSVVAGDAALDPEGLHADHLVLLGSPGAGAQHASQYRLADENSQIHAMTVEGDAISLLSSAFGGVHGVNPTSASFGAKVWEFEGFGGHGSYFDDHSAINRQFLDHLARITEG